VDDPLGVKRAREYRKGDGIRDGSVLGFMGLWGSTGKGRRSVTGWEGKFRGLKGRSRIKRLICKTLVVRVGGGNISLFADRGGVQRAAGVFSGGAELCGQLIGPITGHIRKEGWGHEKKLTKVV